MIHICTSFSNQAFFKVTLKLAWLDVNSIVYNMDYMWVQAHMYTYAIIQIAHIM